MKPENIRLEFERGIKALKAADILLQESLFEDAVSRSYYAVMHTAKAVLLYHDTIAESHAALRRLFGNVLIRPERIEKEWAQILANTQDQRIYADYGALIPITEEMTKHLVANAQTFVQRMRIYLQQQGVELVPPSIKQNRDEKE